jgi:predicted dehydrogenase
MGSASRLRGGIIGFGNVAVRAHLPGWLARADVDIVAVTDVRPERRAEAEARMPAATWYGSPLALLDHRELDFIDICTPPSSHAPLIRAALERDVHVLCEKPLVGTPEELTALATMAAARHRVLHTVHNWHHAPIVRRTTSLIADGLIGELTGLAWHTLRTQPAATDDERRGNWRLDPTIAGGGILTDHGWHIFYVLSRWAGCRATSVTATLEKRRYPWPVEDTATVQLVFPRASAPAGDPVGAEVFLTWASDVRENWAEVRGTHGTITLEDDRVVLKDADGPTREWRVAQPLSSGSQHPEWFGPVVDEFVRELTAARPTRANLEEASFCVAVESSARESSRLGGQPVAVTPPIVGHRREGGPPI